ncbi:hypothetical protein AND_002632 [Anopheles darlingi]|uniref:DDE Tnp4 domain-containing protein n=1 Tax=Anopheles darlingi TaxID=43151 RepID=W5JN88_ANODA|nr:hypothetical protein AND_002632 [Anopheles darlingi]
MWSRVEEDEEDVKDVEDEKKSLPENKKSIFTRRNLRYASDPLSLPEEDFQKWVGLNKEIVLYLVDSLKPEFKMTYRCTATPLILKICASLRFLTTGNYQQGVGNDTYFGLCQSAVSTYLTEFLEAAEKKICPDWIKAGMTEAEKQNARTHFYRESELPGIIQAIDCTHIKIVNPGKDPKRVYRNKKGFYSLNVLLACDHELVFRSVEAKYPGAYQDGFIWNISALRQKINAVPGSREELYNQKHKQAKSIIDRAIALLKTRFRCLLGTKELFYVPKKAATIVNVCVALHNICRAHKIADPPIEPIETDPTENFYDGSEDVSATRIRDSIRESLL